jgi:putative colanic acid biosynthesis glycosyltransferase WcaI
LKGAAAVGRARRRLSLRLLVVGLNFAPEVTGVGRYTGELAAWLAARGHEVTVVTTRPYYPEWRRATGLSRFGWSVERWQGCRIIRCPLYVPRRLGGFRRVLHLGSFGLSSIPAALARLGAGRPDIVAAIVPTLLSAPLALAVARLSGAKAWLHMQDLEVDAAVEMGLLRSRGAVRAGLALERRLVAGFDLVSTISPKMLEALARKGVARERLMLFPNWVDTSHFVPLDEGAAPRRRLGLPEAGCIVLYSGSMGRKQGLETVVAAARLLAGDAQPSPLFLLAGAGPARQELERAAAGLPNLRFLPLQSEAQFNEFLNVGDIHLLAQRREAADLVMPSKLGASLAVGKPVIATTTEDSELGQAIAGAGIVVPPEDPVRLAQAIRDLAADAPRRAALGAAGRRRAQQEMEMGSILERVERRLLTLARRPTPAPPQQPVEGSGA